MPQGLDGTIQRQGIGCNFEGVPATVCQAKAASGCCEHAEEEGCVFAILPTGFGKSVCPVPSTVVWPVLPCRCVGSYTTHIYMKDQVTSLAV